MAFSSCERNNEDAGDQTELTKTPLLFLQGNYNPNIKWAERSDSIVNGKQMIAAMEEVDSGGVWGIKFYLFEESALPLKPFFESKVYDGSLEQSLVKFVKIEKGNYLFYSSTDYFLGTSGGEQYLYVADLQNKKVYSAHLGVFPDGLVKLYVASGAPPAVFAFFGSEVKRDFPDYELVKKDIVIE